MAEYFDVVVIGGGPAGCVTSMLLARTGRSVAVVDKSPVRKFYIGETLSPQAWRLITDLGLSESFLAQDHRPSPGIVSVWGGRTPIANDFLFSPHGCGWHIDRAKFNAMLLDAAIAAGSTFFGETGVATCVEDDDGWQLRIARENLTRALQCRLIVDATGRCPASLNGFPRRTSKDRLIAVAGLAAPAHDSCPSDYTLVEAVDEGWFYSALLPSGNYIVSYMTDGDIYAARRQGSNSFLEHQLSK